MGDSREVSGGPAEAAHYDPQVEAWLDFEPVPRDRHVKGAWTPELQREFIRLLGRSGSPTQAAREMGKDPSGARNLYHSLEGESFREAWDAVVQIALKRRGAETAELQRSAGRTPPTVDHRRKYDPASLADTEDGQGSEDQKWDLIHHVGIKFMRKVAAERSARLAGEIVAADFYLRQITALEVMLDLLSARLGFDANQVLRELRRGDHSYYQIVSTSLSDWMDRSRRLWWSQEGAPERPPHPDVRFLDRRRSAEGDYATQIDQHTYGKCSAPALGYSEDQWALMSYEEQRAARQRQFDEDAAEQRAWEQRAVAEHSERTRSDK